MRHLANTPLLFFLFLDLLRRRPTDVLFSLDLELVEKLSSNIIFPWVGVGRSQCRNRGADSAGGWVISEEGILISAAGGKR